MAPRTMEYIGVRSTLPPSTSENCINYKSTVQGRLQTSYLLTIERNCEDRYTGSFGHSVLFC
jgi:hypothetical protein